MVGYSCDKVNPPKPHLTQAARANVSIFAFILFIFYDQVTPNPTASDTCRFSIVPDLCIDSNSPPSEVYLEDLFTAEYYSSPASLL